MSRSDYAVRLKEAWRIGAEHALYHRDGTWYHQLQRFPGALLDPNGYVLFATEAEFRSDPRLRIGLQVNVPGGISTHPGYKTAPSKAAHPALEDPAGFVASLIRDFADGLTRADSRGPVAVSSRSGGTTYRAGIGPHPEARTVELVVEELKESKPHLYDGWLQTSVPYPEQGSMRCDLCLGAAGQWALAIEVKMLRMLGDNGRPNDNMVAHLLSPYPANRSALTDATKLMKSSLGECKAIMIYAFDYPDWPMGPVIDAFELLADQEVQLGARLQAAFSDLIHPVHRRGAVFGWEVAPRG